MNSKVIEELVRQSKLASANRRVIDAEFMNSNFQLNISQKPTVLSRANYDNEAKSFVSGKLSEITDEDKLVDIMKSLDTDEILALYNSWNLFENDLYKLKLPIDTPNFIKFMKNWLRKQSGILQLASVDAGIFDKGNSGNFFFETKANEEVEEVEDDGKMSDEEFNNNLTNIDNDEIDRMLETIFKLTESDKSITIPKAINIFLTNEGISSKLTETQNDTLIQFLLEKYYFKTFGLKKESNRKKEQKKEIAETIKMSENDFDATPLKSVDNLKKKLIREKVNIKEDEILEWLETENEVINTKLVSTNYKINKEIITRYNRLSRIVNTLEKPPTLYYGMKENIVKERLDLLNFFVNTQIRILENQTINDFNLSPQGIDKDLSQDFKMSGKGLKPKGALLKKQVNKVINHKMPKLIRLFQGSGNKFLDNDVKATLPSVKRFYIDMKKFKNGLLCIKYTSNDNIHPKFRTTIMSKELKSILEHYFNEKKVDKSQINKLSDDEKLIINKLGKLMDITDFLDDTIEDRFNEKYNTLIGIYNSGNANPKIIQQLKQLILHGVQEGILTQKEAYKFIVELSL